MTYPGNNIFQPGKEGSSEKGSGSGSGDKPAAESGAKESGIGPGQVAKETKT